MSIANGDDNSIAQEYIKLKIESIDSEISDINSRLKAEEEKVININDMNEKVNRIARIANNFKEEYDEMFVIERRKLLSEIFDRIEWDGNELSVFIMGD